MNICKYHDETGDYLDNCQVVIVREYTLEDPAPEDAVLIVASSIEEAAFKWALIDITNLKALYEEYQETCETIEGLLTEGYIPFTGSYEEVEALLPYLQSLDLADRVILNEYLSHLLWENLRCQAEANRIGLEGTKWFNLCWRIAPYDV